MQQLSYYAARYQTDEYYSDRPLQHFYAHVVERAGCAAALSTGAARTAVVDVGANTGQDTEQFVRFFGHCPGVRFYFFEPLPAARQALTAEVARRCGAAGAECKVVPYGVGQRPARLYLATPEATSDRTATTQQSYIVDEARARRLSARPHGGHAKAHPPARVHLRPLTVTSLDHFFFGNATALPEAGTAPDRVALLKTDTEGHDAPALFGAARLLDRTDAVVFECHKLWTEAQGSGHRLSQAVRFLSEGHGFRVFKLGHPYSLRLDGPYWHPRYDHLNSWHNCFAARPGSPLLPLLRTLC